MPKYAKAIMIPTLKTKRLALRPLSISDLDAMINIIMSDRDVMYWLPRSEDVTTLEGQQEVASGYITHFTKPWEEVDFGVWAVCIRGTEPEILETFIGYCGFIPEQIEGEGPELAYAIGKSMWGKGFTTKAVISCLDWIFIKPEISRVYGVTDKENIASRRVMEKVEMKHEKDVDLYDPEAKREDLLQFYSIEREVYLRENEN